MADVAITLGADSQVVDEARTMDGGVLVTQAQGGDSVFVVGLEPTDAAALLRQAADAVDPAVDPDPMSPHFDPTSDDPTYEA